MQNDNLTREDARKRAATVSDVWYDTSIVLSGDRTRESDGTWVAVDATFLSTTMARFSAVAPSTFIDVDAAAVREVTLNGVPVDPAAVQGGRLHLTGLLTTPGSVNEVLIVADMEYSTDGIGMHRHVDQLDGRVYLYSNSEPFDSHRWFACFDQPSVKARMQLTVTAPADWNVVANSPVDMSRMVRSGGSQTVTFEPTPLLSTYVMAVCAGEYHAVTRETAGGIPCALLVRQSLVDIFDADRIFTTTEKGLALFPQLYGTPYPFQKYDQVFVPDFNAGAMENAGCVVHADQHYVFRSRATYADFADRANTILHEMAHMWFGDLITMDWWDDLWLNESFATFMANYAKVATGEYPEAWVDFANADKAWALRQDQLPSTHPIAADAPDVRRAQLNFDGITYAKGAAVLRQLVAYVGEDQFFDGLKAYFRRYSWRNATLADFLASLEESSGRDLGGWADGWLRTTGVSTLHPVIELDAGGTYRSVAIAQEPSPDGSLRPHRVVLGCYSLIDGVMVRTDRIEIDVAGPFTAVPSLAGKRVPDLLLVNDEDLTFAKVAFDEHTVATLVKHLGKIEDPLARTICWADMWDMTRDGGFATRDWVDLVAGQAGGEGEIGVLERLLARAKLAVEVYGDPANRTAARAALAGVARESMNRAQPGSDRQLVWALAYINAAARITDLDHLRTWLSGETRVQGIDLNADDAKELRWSIVTRLVATGSIEDGAAEGFIGAELARDTGDVWKKASLTALAARPTVAAKDEAWARITGDGPYNLKERIAMIGGFGQPGQEDVLAPYVERWADLVPEVWDTRSHDLAEAITGGLYPSLLINEHVVTAANRVLAHPGLDPNARRVVVELLDGTQRAQRAQMADMAAGLRGAAEAVS